MEEYQEFYNRLFRGGSRGGFRFGEELSPEDIENKAVEILNGFNPYILERGNHVPLKDFMLFLEKRFGITFKFEQMVDVDSYGNNIIASFSAKEKTITIDNSIVTTNCVSFALMHEIGHFYLHSRSLNDCNYEFRDTAYSLSLNKWTQGAKKNLIDWQANRFASSLLMPKKSIERQLVLYQRENKIRNPGRIWKDYQKDNQSLFWSTIKHLEEYFDVNRDFVEQRLKELKLLESPLPKKEIHTHSIGELLKGSFSF